MCPCLKVSPNVFIQDKREPLVGTAFDSDDHAVDCKLKQLPWMCLVSAFQRKKKGVNNDFENFELGPKEVKHEKQWKMSISRLV